MTPEGAKLDRFYGKAIAELKATAPAAPERQIVKGDKMARGIFRLQNLVDNLTSQIDAVADQAGAELMKKRDRCLGAVHAMKTEVGKVFDNAADSAFDYLGQMTNGEDVAAELPLSDSGDSAGTPATPGAITEPATEVDPVKAAADAAEARSAAAKVAG